MCNDQRGSQKGGDFRGLPFLRSPPFYERYSDISTRNNVGDTIVEFSTSHRYIKIIKLMYWNIEIVVLSTKQAVNNKFHPIPIDPMPHLSSRLYGYTETHLHTRYITLHYKHPGRLLGTKSRHFNCYRSRKIRPRITLKRWAHPTNRHLAIVQQYLPCDLRHNSRQRREDTMATSSKWQPPRFAHTGPRSQARKAPC